MKAPVRRTAKGNSACHRSYSVRLARGGEQTGHLPLQMRQRPPRLERPEKEVLRRGHEGANRFLSLHHLAWPCNMQQTIPLRESDRRARSESRTEVGSIKDPMEVDLVALRPSESTPDLGFGPSVSPASGPFASNNQGSSGMQITLLQIGYLTALFCTTQVMILPFVYSISDSSFKTGRETAPTC